MMKIHDNPVRHIFIALFYSLRGLLYAMCREASFLYETVILVIICSTVFCVPLSLMKRLILIFSWLFVMAFELVNSAVEIAFDLIDKEFRAEIQAGKDMLSASVFLVVCFNMALWVIMLVI